MLIKITCALLVLIAIIEICTGYPSDSERARVSAGYVGNNIIIVVYLNAKAAIHNLSSDP